MRHPNDGNERPNQSMSGSSVWLSNQSKNIDIRSLLKTYLRADCKAWQSGVLLLQEAR